MNKKLKIINQNWNRGFTLIELLIVITIIGILSSLLMVNYMGIRARSRDAQRKSDIRQIQSALELFRSDSGIYPANLPACGSSLIYNSTIYMQKIPCDPTGSAPFIYQYKSPAGNSVYSLKICLENTNDSQKDQSLNPAPLGGGSWTYNCAGGTTNWSYTLNSP